MGSSLDNVICDLKSKTKKTIDFIAIFDQLFINFNY
jgi:hypothetical protein